MATLYSPQLPAIRHWLETCSDTQRWDPVIAWTTPAHPGNAIANPRPCPGRCIPLHELNIARGRQKSVEIADDYGGTRLHPVEVLNYVNFQN